MADRALDSYGARMERVLDHIDRHLDDDLGLAALARVAAFSKYHFHRQFVAAFGITVHRYVQLARMKRASYRLAFRHDANVTAIALDSGYDAADAFARAFRGRVGQVPSAFRRAPDWERWRAAFEPLSQARSRRMTSFSAGDMNVVHFPETRVAVMKHRGDHARLPETIQRFIAWRRAAGLRPKASATFNVFHCDPRATPAADFHLDLCAATGRPIDEHGFDVRAGSIPGGRCAMLRVAGASDDLEPAALFLYRDWLPASGEEPRDFPLFCQRTTFFPDVPEHAAITDLYLPLK
ncbi:MAG: AraC family transcriptional regulator [Gemmatimonadetes bacterium]|nr:AraC family transcriptional regulator [Gemmatimonadota bacterium]